MHATSSVSLPQPATHVDRAAAVQAPPAEPRALDASADAFLAGRAPDAGLVKKVGPKDEERAVRQFIGAVDAALVSAKKGSGLAQEIRAVERAIRRREVNPFVAGDGVAPGLAPELEAVLSSRHSPLPGFDPERMLSRKPLAEMPDALKKWAERNAPERALGHDARGNPILALGCVRLAPCLVPVVRREDGSVALLPFERPNSAAGQALVDHQKTWDGLGAVTFNASSVPFKEKALASIPCREARALPALAYERNVAEDGRNEHVLMPLIALTYEERDLTPELVARLVPASAINAENSTAKLLGAAKCLV